MKITSNVVFFFLILVSWHCYADFPVVTKKYEYGYKFMDDLGFNVLGEEPEFHPLINSEKYTFLYPGYILNDVENRHIQLKKNMFISLSIINNHAGKLNVTTKLTNNSNESYFIHRFFLTLFGLNSTDGYSASCRQDLLIVTNSARLEYVGGKCHGYDDSFNSGDWVEIGPGKIYSMSIDLDNTLYTFPPGHHMYSIGTLEYPFVDAQWFLHQRVYGAMFNILKWRYECKMGQAEKYLMLRSICSKNSSAIKDDFYEFMHFYIKGDGGISQHEFRIRSEQVYIDVDGSELFLSRNNKS